MTIRRLSRLEDASIIGHLPFRHYERRSVFCQFSTAKKTTIAYIMRMPFFRFRDPDTRIGLAEDADCLLCDAAATAPFCTPCQNALPWHRGGCPCCAAVSTANVACGDCLKNAPHFDATVAALHYAFPADKLIQSLKFGARLSLAPILGDLLKRAVQLRAPVLPDLVVPIPLSPSRLASRGFNQAGLIASHLSSMFGVKVRHDLLSRTRETAAQTGLSREERRRNVRGAFAVADRLDGLRIALIDDVMTTGATFDAAAAALKRRGAAHVAAWVVARADHRD